MSDIIEPFSIDRVAAYLRTKELRFTQDDDGDVFLTINNNQLVIAAVGKQQEVLTLGGTWQVSAPIETRARMQELCNDWNRDRMWPKTYVTVDDHGAVKLRAEYNVDLEYGVSDLQLEQLLDCGLSSSMQFFKKLDEEFPDTRFKS